MGESGVQMTNKEIIVEVKNLCAELKKKNPVGLSKMKQADLKKELAKLKAIKTKQAKKSVPAEKPTKKKTQPKTKVEAFVSMCGEDFNKAKNSVCNTDCRLNNKTEFLACKEHFLSAKKAPKEKAQAVPKTGNKTTFRSLCGFDYDPSKASSCNTDCKLNNPEAFALCKNNFSESKINSPGEKKNPAKRTAEGRNPNSQIAAIEATIKSGLFTEAEIIEKTGVSTARLRRFFRQVTYREGRLVLKNDKGQVFFQQEHPKRKGEQAYIIKDVANSSYIKKYGNALAA